MLTAGRDRYRLTVAEFLLIIPPSSEHRDWELVAGDIWEPGSVRVDLVETVAMRLRDRHPGRVRTRGSIELSTHSLVSPDVFVLQPGAEPEGDFWQPGQVAHVYELDDQCSAFPDPKLRAYADAGLPALSIIGTGHQIDLFTLPNRDRYEGHVVRDLADAFD